MQHISFNAPHQVDHILPQSGRQIASLSNSQITKFDFRVKITVLYRPFFQTQNVISQVLALTHNEK